MPPLPIPKGPSANVPELTEAPENDDERIVSPFPNIALASVFASLDVETEKQVQGRSEIAKATRKWEDVNRMAMMQKSD